MDEFNYPAENTTDESVTFSKIKWNRISNIKAVQEIMTYLQNIMEYKNPFERAWAAAYELPLFILFRIKSSMRYSLSEMLVLYEEIIRWCALLNSDISDDYIACFFYIKLEKIFG